MKTLVHYWRNRKGKSMRQLSQETGVAQKTINDIENGHTLARPITRTKLSTALGILPDQIVTFDDTNPEADGNWKGSAREEPPAA